MSRAVQALEAAELAPASRATLEDLIALHPPRFVPLECERRLQLKQDIERARAKRGWKKLSWAARWPDAWRCCRRPPALLLLTFKLTYCDIQTDLPGRSHLRQTPGLS